jgi:site-specific DNA recombinase
MTRTKRQTPRKAIIYTRLSNDPSGAATNVANQERSCRILASDIGAAVVAVKVDDDRTAYGKGGRRAKRPAFDAMLDMIKNGLADTIIVWHVDRLYRQTADLELLVNLVEQTGAMIRPVMTGELDLSNASGRMVARILASVSAHEIEHSIERMTEKKQANRAAGIQNGGPRAYGYRATKPTPKGMPPETPKVNPREADWIRFAADKILSGASLRSVVAAMNAGGARTPRGAAWLATSLAKMIQSARLAGLIEHGGVIVGPASWEAIIDEGTLFALRAVLRDPSRRQSVGNTVKYLLPGLATCGICGQPMRSTGKNRTGQSTYGCPDKHVMRTIDPLDDFVEKLIVARLARPDALGLFPSRATADRPDTAALEAKAAALRTRLASLADAFADDDESDPMEYRAASQKIKTRLADVESAIAAAVVQSAPSELDAVDLPALARLFDPEDIAPALEWWRATYGLETRRTVLDTLMTVTVLPAKRGRPAGHVKGQPYFDPSAVRIEWRTA